jgi:hypothetical protein
VINKKLLCLIASSLLLAAAGVSIVRADNGPQHRQEQSRPIKLGTSGGNINYSSAFYCCGGTLGALVEDNEGQYILSNNHILARTNTAIQSEEIIQPGLIDQSPLCYEDVNDTVAYLTDFVEIKFQKAKAMPTNRVDAAIAQIIPGVVEPNGAILDIGVISSQIAKATPGLAVKKSGRTTGLTTGIVSAVHVTVNVAYPEECGGTTYQWARFKNQILIEKRGFCAGGDSGSLIVEDVELLPRAVGLLFAGSADGRITVANPIGLVLEAMNVSVVGAVEAEPKLGMIVGTVINRADGNPIEAATVVVDTGESAATDANGFYIVDNVEDGRHFVEISADGFKPKGMRGIVFQDEETIIDFALTPDKSHSQSSFDTTIDHAVKVKDRCEQDIFKIKGVVGVGVSLSDDEEPVIEVYLKEDNVQTRTQMPDMIDDVPVRLIVTGQFEAL